MREKTLYYYSMTCPWAKGARDKTRPCATACRLDCHWLAVDDHHKYYCKHPGRGYVLNGGISQ